MVAVGLTVVDPMAAVEVNVPGAIAIVAALAVVQLSVLLAPLAMLMGFAANVAIAGGGAGVG